MELQSFMEGVKKRNPGQPEFHQAVCEFADSVIPFINANPKYEKAAILERMVEPDRLIMFRVAWEDDNGNVRVNRGYRVQFNNAIGPYKGGLRFDKSVSASILKFLGFEQTFKNSLTTLPMGGAKGGSNFNPKGKSDREVMRFCQAYMTELYRHIGKDVDIPAGDIGVGAREVSYLFGQYKRLQNEFTGTLTGKGLAFGGSPVRTEATGYGLVYLAKDMLEYTKDTMKGKTAIISGSGNVATYAAEKLLQLGASVHSLSDRGGTIYFKDGMSQEQLNEVIELKTVKRGTLQEYAQENSHEFLEGKKPWSIKADLAFPCATQNELEEEDAKALVTNGVQLVGEGANMPTTLGGIKVFQDAKIMYAPSKAANAGGVAISGLEMTQNAMKLTWTHEKVDSELQKIMKKIHETCVQWGKEQDGHVNYLKGANIGGFVKVADAMLAYGVL